MPYGVAFDGREAPRLSDDVQVCPVGGHAVGLVVQRPAEERRRQCRARRGVDLEDYGIGCACARALGVPDRKEPGADPDDSGENVGPGTTRGLAPDKIAGLTIFLDEEVPAVVGCGTDSVNVAPEGHHAQE